MNRLKVALAAAALALMAPSCSFAQVPGATSSKSPARSDARVKEIMSIPSDIADLSKFEDNEGYLPKSIYKPHYKQTGGTEQTIASQGRHHI